MSKVKKLVGGNSGTCGEFKINFIPWKKMSSRDPKLGNTNKNVFFTGAISSKKPSHVRESTPNLPGYLDRKFAELGPECLQEGGSPGLGPRGQEHPRGDQTGRPMQDPGLQLELATLLSRKRGRNSLPKRDPTAASLTCLTWSARRRKAPHLVPGVSSGVKT